MMERAWERLADGSGTPVLVVDFLQFTAARSLGSVLAAQGGGRPVFRADPVGLLTRSRNCVGITELADEYAKLCAGLTAFTGRPPLVVGYCSAAALALRVAERLGGPCGPPCHCVLVQPTWPTGRKAWEEFESFRAQWADGEPPAPWGPCPDGEEPEAALGHMMAVLETETAAAATRRGLGTPEGQDLLHDLLDRYRAWLGFQLTVAHDVRAGPAPAIAPRLVGGNDDRLGLPWPDSRPPRTVYLPVAGQDLLEAAELPAAVLSATGDEGSGGL
ncbi:MULTISPECIES: hypothetical protein [Streptomyces]|nr:MULTISPECIES: hypothetical protein [Streptomyces]MYT09022.1 hypothetical protein [Streptomyces sp. SID5470]